MACLKEKPGSAFLLRAGLSTERSVITLAFPPKAVADLLIEKYFNSYDPGARECSLCIFVVSIGLY